MWKITRDTILYVTDVKNNKQLVRVYYFIVSACQWSKHDIAESSAEDRSHNQGFNKAKFLSGGRDPSSKWGLGSSSKLM